MTPSEKFLQRIGADAMYGLDNGDVEFRFGSVMVALHEDADKLVVQAVAGKRSKATIERPATDTELAQAITGILERERS